MFNLTLKFVYKNLSTQEKQDVINMWINAKVLPENEAIKRVEQVSVIIFNDKNIVGVSTIYPAFLSENNIYFFFRMFILPQYRGSNLTRTQVMQLNFNQLKEFYSSKIKGIAMELENSKLAHLGKNTNYMQKRGYTYFAQSARDLQLWYVDFDNPKGIFLK